MESDTTLESPGPSHLPDLVQLRADWVIHVASLIRNTTTTRIIYDESLSAVEHALLVVHAGIGHLRGIDVSDSAVPNFLTQDQVTALISRYWRDGALDPYLARTTRFLWQGLLFLARDLGLARPSILEYLAQSQLAKRVENDAAVVKITTTSDTRANSYLETAQFLPPEPHGTLSKVPSHLGAVFELICTDMERAKETFTLLEILACLPIDNDSDIDKQIVALDWVRNHHEITLSVPGGWPGPEADGIPDWVTDIVIHSGARMFYTSTGNIPGWFIVAESDDELRAITHWSYNPAFGIYQDSGGAIIVAIPLTFQNGQSSRGEWRYFPHRLADVMQLTAMLAIGMLRLDVYQLDAHGALSYIFAVGKTLPEEFIYTGINLLGKQTVPDKDLRLFERPTFDDVARSMSLVERNLFDGLNEGLVALRSTPDSALGQAFSRFLTALDSATASHLGGVDGSQVYAQAREHWRIALAQGVRSVGDIDPSILGPGRAYVQFSLKVDWPVRLIAVIVYVDESGLPQFEKAEFDGEINLEHNLEQQAAALAAGFTELGKLRALGVDYLVINPSTLAYNLPLHEASLLLGFSEVSFTHRLGTLFPRSYVTSRDNVEVVGFSGVGQRRIAAVDVELDVVRRLYGGSSSSNQISRPISSILHIAGHGFTGFESYSIALDYDANDSLLTSARVLQQFEASETRIVFLSSCSSGEGKFRLNQVAEAVPLDVAFVEAGAQCVISTSAPVNDYLACIFAYVFHKTLSAGSSVWQSYVAARTAIRTGQLSVDTTDLDEIWPVWRVEFESALVKNSADWVKYRLSGRHWD